MIWCCDRLSATVNCKNDQSSSEDGGDNFVESMDMALELLEPMTMYSITSPEPAPNPSDETCTIQSKSIDYADKSRTIRLTVEKLMRHALAFICVVPESDKQPLMTLCHKVMETCIQFEEICCVTECTTDDDKRMKAEHVQYALHSLDKLVNECLMRLFFIVFAELNQSPVAKLRTMNKSIDDQIAVDAHIEKFDVILDRLTQIGAFAVAYSPNAKGN